MARKKSNKIISTFKIFFSSIKTYFLYLDQCSKYLAFPVLGQLISIAIIFTCTYYFNINIDNIRNLLPLFETDKNLFILLLVILLPFFIVLIKAIYDYVIAFSALNILFFTVSNKKKVKNIDFEANKKVIERRLFNYIILLFLVALFSIIPPLILLIPFSLIFQIFALETDKNALQAVSRSIEMIKGNIIPTIIMLSLCGILTYWFLPSLFIWAFEKVSFISFLIGRIEVFANLFQYDAINDLLSIVNIEFDALTIAKNLAENVISFAVIAFTLPLRCCCFTELYKLFDSEKIKDFSKESDEIITRATGSKRKN